MSFEDARITDPLVTTVWAACSSLRSEERSRFVVRNPTYEGFARRVVSRILIRNLSPVSRSESVIRENGQNRGAPVRERLEDDWRLRNAKSVDCVDGERLAAMAFH